MVEGLHMLCENAWQNLKHNVNLILIIVSLPLPTLPWESAVPSVDPNDKIVDCAALRIVRSYLDPRSLAPALLPGPLGSGFSISFSLFCSKR